MARKILTPKEREEATAWAFDNNVDPPMWLMEWASDHYGVYVRHMEDWMSDNVAWIAAYFDLKDPEENQQ